MILGGDLGTEEVVPSNSARFEGGEWTATEAAPIPGAVYGSSGTRYGGDTWVVAVSPTASAASADGGGTWIPLADVFAWAVEFAPAGGTAWAAGTQGRVWRINLPR